MNFDLTPEHELVRSTVREFAEQRVAPVAAELDREHRFPYELVAELAELGLMGMPIPEEYGGAGTDTLSYAIAVEELTRIDSSVAITMAAHTSLGTMPILLFGSEEQKQQWLPDLASGRKLAAFGLTEPGAGSDAARRAHDRGAARRPVGRERLEDLHHQRGHRHHGVRDDHRAHRRGRDLEPDRPERHAGLRDLGADGEARLARLRHARALVPRLRRPRGEPARRARQGVHAVPRDPRRRPDLRRRDGRRARAGRLRPRLRLREGAPAVRQADLEVPGDPVPARRHGGRDRGRPRADLQGRRG